MQLILEIHEGNKRRNVPVEDPEIGIGRGADNAIVINDPRSSRRHCVLRRTPQGLLLEDLESRNGTVLNGAAISRSILKAGDTFEVGQVRFFLREDGDSSLAQETEEEAELAADDAADEVSKTVVAGGGKRDSGTAQTITALPEDAESWSDNVFLEGVEGPWAGERIDVRKSPFVVGRSRSCDLTLRDKRASGRHAQILRRGNRFFVEDLGSTNGTAVNRRPIQRARLADGALIQLGSGSFRFHVPPEIADAVTSAEPGAAAEAEIGVGEESRRIDMDRLLAGSSTGQPWIALVLAAVALLVAYSVWDVAQRAFARRDLDPVDRDNLVRLNWSFEEPLGETAGVPGWGLAEGSRGELRVTDELAQLPGLQALEVTGAVAGELCLASYQEEVPIETGRTYRLEGFVANSSGAFAAGFAIDWLRQGKRDLLLLERSFSETVRNLDEAIDVGQEVVPPAGADYARLACFVFGAGSAVFDRVRLVPAVETPPEEESPAAERRLTVRAQDAPPLFVRLAASGTLGMRAASRLELATLWGGLDTERDPLLMGPRLAPMRSAAPGDGEILLVEEVPDVTERAWVTVEKNVIVGRAEITARLRTARDSSAAEGEVPPRLCLYLEPRSSSLPLIGHGETVGTIQETSVPGGPYQEIVLGEGDERVSLSFDPPVRTRRLEHPAASWRTVWELAVEGGGAVEVSLSTGARFEASEARGVLQSADNAYREGRVGQAIRLLEGLSERFKGQPTQLREANERLGAWRAEAAGGLRVLQADLAELRELPARAMFDSLQKRAKSFAQRFEGVAEGAAAGKLHDELEGLWAGLAEAEASARVGERLERAQQHFSAGKLALAELYFRLAAEEADAEQRREAKNWLERVRQRRETEAQVLLKR